MGKISSDRSKTAVPMESPSYEASSSSSVDIEGGRPRLTKTDLDSNGTGDDHFTAVPVEIGHPHPDYFRVSNCMKYRYDNIFMEPSSIRNGLIGKHLSPRLNVVFGCVFNGTQEAIYFFMSMITGLIAGFFWGMIFAMFIYLDVWFIQPINVLMLAIIHTVVTPVTASIRSVLDPLFQSCGQVFAYISVTARLKMLHSLRSSTEAEPRRALAGTLTRYDSRTSDWLGFV